MPVNHSSQPTTLHVLNSKVSGMHRDRTTALGGQQQHDVNSAGHIVTDDRNKARGSSLLFLASAVWTNDTSRNIKELPFSNFLHLNEGWRTAKPGSEHLVNPMIRP